MIPEQQQSTEWGKPIFPCEAAKLQLFQGTCCPPVFAFGLVLRLRCTTGEGSPRHWNTLPVQEAKNKSKGLEGREVQGRGQNGSLYSANYVEKSHEMCPSTHQTTFLLWEGGRGGHVPYQHQAPQGTFR